MGLTPHNWQTQLSYAVSFFKAQELANPQLEAEVLLMAVMNWNRVELYLHLLETCTEEKADQYRALAAKRVAGEPLQYLTGKQEFMSLDLMVNKDVLIPRADTEILVEAVLRLKNTFGGKAVIWDVCTGSGAVAIALKTYWPEAEVYATDISEAALNVAKSNAALNQVEITFAKADLMQSMLTQTNWPAKFNIIVSNPPYISSKEISFLQREVQLEPALALDGGSDGLDFYRRLLAESVSWMMPKGQMLWEIGHQQLALLAEEITASKWKLENLYKDYQDLHRVICLKI